MNWISPQLSVVVSTVVEIIISVITSYLAYKVKQRDQEMVRYRKEREEKEDAVAEKQRIMWESNNRLTLGMARSMLLQEYNKIVKQQYYPIEDRDVYHALFQAYVAAGGNSTIVSLAEKAVELSTQPPKEGQ